MLVMGLGGSDHDFSACIIRDGIVEIMIEDERITRKKYGVNLGINLGQGYSRNYCLKHKNYDIDSIDMFVTTDITSPLMYARIGKDVNKINHHLAHAASAFYPSDYESAAILVLDAVGSKIQKDGTTYYESATYAYGENNYINVLDKQYGIAVDKKDIIENSLGIFYSISTRIVGFSEHEEGKTMGLAPYGTDFYYNELKKLVNINYDGKIQISKNSYENMMSFKEHIEGCRSDEVKFQRKADFAYATQRVLEEVMLHMAEYLKSLTKSKSLCLAGGVALNSVANYKIYKSGLFDNVFIQPASGDNGTSIGSALYGFYGILRHERKASNIYP